MTPQELARRFPRLYHMANLDSWTSILERGLLSTTALLDLFQIAGAERFSLESQWRSDSCSISHSEHGVAVIRDQIPMPEGKLQKLLTGATTQKWYELINGKTFFWVDSQRLTSMLNARQYRARSHAVFVIDTEALLDRHLRKVTLSEQNSGSLYSGKIRGPSTFKRVGDYPFDRIAELAVEYSVPDIADFAIRVEERKADKMVGMIWERAQ